MEEIRRAREGDIPGIMELLRQVNLVHYEGRPDLFKKTTKYKEEELRSIIAGESTPLFVCVSEEGKVLGHAFCIKQQHVNDPLLTDVRTLYIDDICVDEAARGKHIGERLYHYVEDYAGQEGFYNITLNVWNCNPGAMAFYEKLGLEPYKVGMERIL